MRAVVTWWSVVTCRLWELNQQPSNSQAQVTTEQDTKPLTAAWVLWLATAPWCVY